jgi:uncharacterized protein YfdQ (DUF2303 family)
MLKEAIELLLNRGRDDGRPTYADGANVPLVNGKAMPELVFNEYRAQPHRIKQTVKVLDAASFIAYFNTFSEASSGVFAHEPTQSVTAVIDYHKGNEGGSSSENVPHWGSHRLVLELQKSPRWNVWFSRNNKQFTQQDFAEFLEQYRGDIIKPSSGAVMDIARDLEATTEGEFSSGMRMADGSVKFKCSQTVRTTVQGAEVQVPDAFTIEVPVFVGGSPVQMECMLRFRVQTGKLAIWFTLVDPEEVIRQAFLQQRNTIETELKIVIINGQVT